MNRIRTLFLLLIFFIGSCSSENQKTEMVKPARSRLIGVVSDSFLQMMKDPSQQMSHDTTLDVSESGEGYFYLEQEGRQFHIVHNGKRGADFVAISDPVLTRDGKRLAYVAITGDTFRKVIDNGAHGPVSSDIGMPQFTSDGKHLVYTMKTGTYYRLVVDHRVVPAYHVVNEFVLTPEMNIVAFATVDEKKSYSFLVSDIEFKKPSVFKGCGEQYAASPDRTRVAVVCSEGEKRYVRVIDLVTRKLLEETLVPSEGTLYHFSFSTSENLFTFGHLFDDGRRHIYYKGKTAPIPKGDEILAAPVVQHDPERVITVIGMATKARIFSAFGSEKVRESSYGVITDLIVSPEGRHRAYIAIPPGGDDRMKIVVDGNEGPLFDKIVSPRFSPDGKYLVYRARQSGKRFVVLSDLNGKILKTFDQFDMVFPPRFSSDSKSIIYAALQGNKLWWRVEEF